ncbi:MAG: DEAD/DEAH box helicase family protein [Clostridiales bacterium]|nr:DEAD/DEAH box helicase family protein [Clostridiales bacterium]
MQKTYIERVIEEISYESLGEWSVPNLSDFSYNKTLFWYQQNAVKNAAKVLYKYFNSDNGKQTLYSDCIKRGMPEDAFNVSKYARPIDKKRNLVDERYLLLSEYYDPTQTESDDYIAGSNFFNRIAFWMATGSGKSLVLIKMIEYLYYLQSKDLIPKKDIMLLLPRDHLITQFKREISNYNRDKNLPIELVSLIDYEEDKYRQSLINTIKVYYYRSDLIRGERKTIELDFRDYDNNGDWYIFLDEAHRGETGTSLMQDYVSILSRNGFLFNFSATFTDAIDYATTCYNFNLEKFIGAGYGKNIYLTRSYFNFSKDRDDFSELEKQKQVLKSLITLAMVKKAKQEGVYHNPLMVTLVNSVNTEDSDLLLFFEKLEEIAGGHVDEEIFISAKNELIKDYQYKSYVFGDEKLDFELSLLETLELKDIFENVFNARNHGKIEIMKGEKGKELVLKLETAEKPFALIKIGDTDKFQHEKLGDSYSVISGYDDRSYFENINQDDNINILIGSRSFYEGWDSNRPNVINFINMGSKNAKKYVSQAIGRGVRIEPYRGERKRLPYGDPNKNKLLETLFIFATDKNGVKNILETMDEQKHTDEHEILLFEKNEKSFDLLIPQFKQSGDRDDIAYFSISQESKEKFQDYFNCFDKNVLLLKTGMSEKSYDFLKKKIDDGTLFRIDPQKLYYDMDMLLQNITEHIQIKNIVVGNIKELTDEILHFKHVKVVNLIEDEIKAIEEKIKKVKSFRELDKKQLATDYAMGKIGEKEFVSLITARPKESFDSLRIVKLAQHYYLPLVYSTEEKIEYIKHIIKVDSEVKFIENLIKCVENKEYEYDWMFCKIDESMDNIYIPYYNRITNKYSRFYPDFIFWINRGDDYKIVFVDPKGTSYTDYQNKVDEFERIFTDNGVPNEYSYKNFRITFDLKLITDNKNAVAGNKYENYWLDSEDFSFLEV